MTKKHICPNNLWKRK